MSWILPKLNNRVQVLKPTQRPNDEGGLDLVFGVPFEGAFDVGEFDMLAPLTTVWMGFQPIGYKTSGTKYIRGKQVAETATHEFIVRHLAVASLGKEFGLSFSGEFKYMPDLNPLKSDYFLFVQNGSAVKGRLFRVHEAQNIREQNEYLSIVAEEIEERGTGYSI
ncbi:MAG: head-tail adaptor protein [Gammaproteobacteria bacterium]|nr:head-tail adaptor protein [Gammaproteobacteria bacterium]MBU2685923.1 head-tail adaptor protein [Gammaproteobacteria bacterium]